MKTVRTIEVLCDAREILAAPAGWTRGVMARDCDGRQVSPYSPRASCFCVLGAIAHVISKKLGVDFSFDSRAVDVPGTARLTNALNLLARRRTGGNLGIMAASDYVGRDAAVAILDDAIAELEAA